MATPFPNTGLYRRLEAEGRLLHKNWALYDVSGAQVSSNSSCYGTNVPNLPAGSYRLSVTRNGKSGTYKLGLFLAPPEVSDVTLPQREDKVTDGGIAEKILANAPGGAVYIEPTDKNAGGFFTVPKVVE